MRSRACAAALLIAAAALALYRATLLPGFDFGDTGSFQATVTSDTITPRDGYPLYFALGKVSLRLTHAEPARALNLATFDAIGGPAAAGYRASLFAPIPRAVVVDRLPGDPPG